MGSSKNFANFVPATQIAYVDGKPTTIHLRRCKLVAHHEEGPKEYVFDQNVVTLGSAEENDLQLTEPTVSRVHAKIVQEEGAYVLRDMGSTNGSFISGVRVREAFMNTGAEFRLGNLRMSFHAVDETLEISALSTERFGDIIGRDIRMREIFGMLDKIAPTGATVVIEGETGTGKEVVAQTIHKMSPRADKPFIVFDCSAIPESLIESELFGHEKGSFTGAIMTRQGLFEMAQGGTIFLDELGELSVDLQPKLLRVLEQREVRRVGSGTPIPINVRVIAATNRNLEEEVKAGRFREDLFYRLSVVRLFLPPLRQRPDDVSLLVDHFVQTQKYNRLPSGALRVNQVSPEAMRALQAHAWPGNVRELVNVIERGCSFAEGSVIGLADLPEHIRRRADFGKPEKVEEGEVPSAALHDKTFKEAKEQWVSSFERDYIVALLTRNGNNISHAAREADIDRKYFRKLMKKYQINTSRS